MEMGENLYELATKLVKDKGSRKKLGEEPMLELLEEVCDADSDNGEWINKIDIVGSRGVLKLKRKSQPGKCGKECKAVTKVCEDTRTQAGESDIAEKLFRGHYTSSGKEFANALCNKMTDSCKKPSKELKKKRVDEPFTAIDLKEWEAKKLQKKMKSLGMGGQLYDRESIKQMAAEHGDMSPYDDAGEAGSSQGSSQGSKSDEEKKRRVFPPQNLGHTNGDLDHTRSQTQSYAHSLIRSLIRELIFPMPMLTTCRICAFSLAQ
jgi:hypothetical protein